MDHHCPWISNCVGFSNRKFFMLFLLYIIINLAFCIGCEIFLLVQEYIGIAGGSVNWSVHTIIRSLGLIIQMAFLGVISNFFKFHMELVLTNSSTLDNLERQRNPNTGPNVFDIGPYNNLVQVFGTNWWLWPIPLIPQSSLPGNGVSWEKNQ
jgi:palmitoyltransferase